MFKTSISSAAILTIAQATAAGYGYRQPLTHHVGYNSYGGHGGYGGYGGGSGHNLNASHSSYLPLPGEKAHYGHGHGYGHGHHNSGIGNKGIANKGAGHG